MKRVALALLACLAATYIVRMGPLRDGGPLQLSIIAAIWLAGFLFVLTRARRGRDP